MANPETESALEKLEKLHRELGTPEAPPHAAADDTMGRSIEGFRFYEQGRYREARDIFKALVALEPRQAFHRAALGLVHLAMDELSAAERELTRSIALSDREPSAFVNRGEIYLREGRYADAARDFDRASRLLPEAEDPIAKRARLLASTAREMLAATRSTVQRKPAKVAKKAAPKTKAKAKPKAKKAKTAKKAARRTGRTRRK